jgi:hypothetical protein
VDVIVIIDFGVEGDVGRSASGDGLAYRLGSQAALIGAWNLLHREPSMGSSGYTRCGRVEGPTVNIVASVERDDCGGPIDIFDTCAVYFDTGQSYLICPILEAVGDELACGTCGDHVETYAVATSGRCCEAGVVGYVIVETVGIVFLDIPVHHGIYTCRE